MLRFNESGFFLSLEIMAKNLRSAGWYVALQFANLTTGLRLTATGRYEREEGARRCGGGRMCAGN